MEIDTAAEFLVGSILFGLGFSVLTIAVVFINNVFHKYWKPVTIFQWPKFMDNPPTRFMTPEEAEQQRVAPTLDPESKPVNNQPKR